MKRLILAVAAAAVRAALSGPRGPALAVASGKVHAGRGTTYLFAWLVVQALKNGGNHARL